MKYAIVPAQIMTVEDRITGNLSLPQMILLFVPVFAAVLAYVGLPPIYEYAAYKIAFVLAAALVCGLSAIRIKGRILIVWATVMLSYNLRPRYYIYNKNDAYLRESVENTAPQKVPAEEKPQEEAELPAAPQLSVAELVQLESILANPKANVRFINEKGRLRVRATEIK
jgi:hypothetical protein